MLDDLSMLVEKEMLAKLPKMVWKAYLGLNAMSKRLQSTAELTKFLLDRFVAELKNILDPRYKHHINLQCFNLDVLHYELDIAV